MCWGNGHIEWRRHGQSLLRAITVAGNHRCGQSPLRAITVAGNHCCGQSLLQALQNQGCRGILPSSYIRGNAQWPRQKS